MNWPGAWIGRWFGGWLGTSGEDGAVYGVSAQTLDATTGSALGALDVAGNGSTTLAAISGSASATSAIAGTSNAALGDVAPPAPAVAPPKPFVGVGGGSIVGRRVRPAIAGRSVGTLDDVNGKATGKVTAASTPGSCAAAATTRTCWFRGGDDPAGGATKRQRVAGRARGKSGRCAFRKHGARLPVRASSGAGRCA